VGCLLKTFAAALLYCSVMNKVSVEFLDISGRSRYIFLEQPGLAMSKLNDHIWFSPKKD